MLNFDSSHLMVTRASRVSSAPPNHTLPAFPNYNGIKIFVAFNDNFAIENLYNFTLKTVRL